MAGRSAHAPRRMPLLRLVAGVSAAIFALAIAVAFPSADARAASSVDDVKPVVSDAGFTHPGVFDSLDSLKSTKARVRAGDAPWAGNFKQLASSPFIKRGTPDFKRFGSAGTADPTTRACSSKDPKGCVTVCGSFNSDPSTGCSDQQADSRAVYGLALMYWYTGDGKYAQRAIAILNAYSKHFKGSTGSNGPLMTAWTAALMTRGAELIRYTYEPTSSGKKFDVAGYEALLRKVFVPTLTSFDYGRFNGNWKLSAAEGLISAAVFLDDRTLYDQAVRMWRERTPAYIYLSTDGDLPARPQNDEGAYQTPTTLRCQWLDNKSKACQSDPMKDPGTRFQNGQAQETCRDLSHTSMGLGGIINTAETAWIQGEDLYGEQQQRIISGVLYSVEIAQNYKAHGWPAAFCANTEELSSNLSLSELPVDTFYNAYAVRKDVEVQAIPIPGYPAPQRGSDPTKKFIDSQRAGHGYAGNVTAWEGLTHHLASAPAPRPSSTPTPTAPPTSTPTRQATAEPEDTSINPLDVATTVFAAVGVIASIAFLVLAGRRWARRRGK